MKLLGLAVATIVSLTACVLPTAKDKYGKGPLPSRAMVEAYYAQYLTKASPQYFFVANDGSNIGYSYCEASTCSGSELQVAEESCRARSRGAPCSIYARNRTVVWDEGVPATKAAPAPRTSSNPAPVATAKTEPAPIASSPNVKSAPEPVNASEPETISRPIAIKWEGYPSLIAGTAAIRAKGESGEMTMTLPNNDGRCTGSYRGTNQGTWSVACTNGLAASGTYQMRGAGMGSTGIGTDTKGRAVEFTVGGST